MTLIAAGALVGVLAADDQAQVDDLSAQVIETEAESDRLAISLDRLRAERNRLESQLAARREAPVCPSESSSTADGGLPLRFSVDYPCGWHVVHDAITKIASPDHPGIRGNVTLFSQLPIALAPESGPLADIEVIDWFDDPSDTSNGMPTLKEFLDAERAAFVSAPAEEVFEGGAGITIHVMEGSFERDERAVDARVLVWFYDDPLTGARHIVRAVVEDGGRLAIRALDRLARSFAVV